MPASAEAPRRVGVTGPTTGPNAFDATGILPGSGNSPEFWSTIESISMSWTVLLKESVLEDLR